MNKILSDELTSAIAKVGELVKSDVRYHDYLKASEEYTSNSEINALLDEYSALQGALSAEYEKEDFDGASVKPIRDRMNEIYSNITSAPAYVSFREASELYTELSNEIYAELEYAVTGKRKTECTHDCSTCHGCD